jgi:hypothetical protein
MDAEREINLDFGSSGGWSTFTAGFLGPALRFVNLDCIDQDFKLVLFRRTFGASL